MRATQEFQGNMAAFGSDFGFTRRTRSDQSGEQSAKELQEVDHPGERMAIVRAAPARTTFSVATGEAAANRRYSLRAPAGSLTADVWQGSLITALQTGVASAQRTR